MIRLDKLEIKGKCTKLVLGIYSSFKTNKKSHYRKLLKLGLLLGEDTESIKDIGQGLTSKQVIVVESYQQSFNSLYRHFEKDLGPLNITERTYNFKLKK